MEKKYTIVDTKYNLQERMTKRYGKVHDVYFYVFDEDGSKKQKKLSGFKTKADAKFAYTEFIAENCAVSKEKPQVVEIEDAIPTVGELLEKYIKSLHNQNKESTIVDKIGLYNLYVLSKYKDTPIIELTHQFLLLLRLLVIQLSR